MIEPKREPANDAGSLDLVKQFTGRAIEQARPSQHLQQPPAFSLHR
ncbi:MAG: hypothetical protein ACJA1F_001042, partial [Paracoccaceae bacterium]